MRKVFDLLLGEVTSVERVQWLAVIAHALGAMAAHLSVQLSCDLTITFIQPAIKLGLLDDLPRIPYSLLSRRREWGWVDGKVFGR